MLKYVGMWFGLFLFSFGANVPLNSKYGARFPRRSILIGAVLVLAGLTVAYFVE